MTKEHSHQLFACSGCKKPHAGKFRCGGCRNVFYCGQRCQEKDWPRHQALCSWVDDTACEQEDNKKKPASRSSLKQNKKDVKKHIHWQKGLITETEAQIARICFMLQPKETVKVAIRRYTAQSNNGDAIAYKALKQLKRAARMMMGKGMNFIYRVPKEKLHHMAADEEHLRGASIDLSNELSNTISRRRAHVSA
uniref:MYND-type domain-containing protein n=1 Tax=Lotharella oceanica TaxID=641309 RepID=A0A7S2TYV9_9EUKA|mmetsp:Transcript_34277/g.63585  ORF Transcript_34277/g.63585 Transcript_34277/m.63585 type:complete len:194 (+) Transcript_34277:315-896(+)